MTAKSVSLLLFVLAPLAADSGGGMHWTIPTNWKTEGQRPMRVATYSVAPAAGDAEKGECGVYYFGSGQGGSVEANIDRWIGQFQQPNGKSSKDVAKVDKQTIHGLKVTTVDVSGAYTGMAGPAAPHGQPMPGYRLLGAVVEGPQGSVFFKFTGPAKTVAANRAQFDKMLSTLSPQ